jgi:hypothetical protein
MEVLSTGDTNQAGAGIDRLSRNNQQVENRYRHVRTSQEVSTKLSRLGDLARPR